MGGQGRFSSRSVLGFWWRIRLPSRCSSSTVTTNQSVSKRQKAAMSWCILRRSIWTNSLATLAKYPAASSLTLILMGSANSCKCCPSKMAMVMTGLEAVSRIRKIEELRDTVILGFSASVFDSDKKDFFRAGGVGGVAC